MNRYFFKLATAVCLMLMPMVLSALEKRCDDKCGAFTGQYIITGSTVSGPSQITFMSICQICGLKGTIQFDAVSFFDSISGTTIVVDETAAIPFTLSDIKFIGPNAAHGKLTVENFNIDILGTVNIEASFIATGNENGQTEELTLTGFKILNNPFSLPPMLVRGKRTSE